MSLTSRLKEAFGIGFGGKRREAIDLLEQHTKIVTNEVSHVRQILPDALEDPQQSKDLFDFATNAFIEGMNDDIRSMRAAKTSEDITIYGSLWQTDLVGVALLTDLEAVNINQHKIKAEMVRLIDALRSETITKGELNGQLEKIKTELETKIPDEESMKNIAWVKDFLTHSSQVGGEGA